MEDITLYQADGITVCKINNFSDELKGYIRSDLSAMCYGKKRSVKTRITILTLAQ